MAGRDIKAPLRPDLYVVARFLDRLCQPDAAYNKARLQLAVRLNYDLFRSYLLWLHEKGFAETQTVLGHDMVVATAKGREAHQRLVGWIKQVLGDSLP